MCAKQFCTILVSLVDLQLQLQLYSCTSIQIQQRVLVALIRIAHGRILRFIYAGPAYLRYSSESSALDPFGLDPITPAGRATASRRVRAQ